MEGRSYKFFKFKISIFHALTTQKLGHLFYIFVKIFSCELLSLSDTCLYNYNVKRATLSYIYHRFGSLQLKFEFMEILKLSYYVVHFQLNNSGFMDGSQVEPEFVQRDINNALKPDKNISLI